MEELLCPISDPEIGIISENDHKVGLCLCRFCECEEHICPGKPRRKHLTYRSQYRSHYQQQSFDVPLKPTRELYTPNALKMDFKTTHNADFVPFEVKPRTRNLSSPPKNKIKIINRSGYKADFPNWGPSHALIEKRWHPPSRGHEIYFSGKSTYRETYQKTDPGLSWNSNQFNKDSFYLGTKGFTELNTTYAKSMKDYSRNNNNSRVSRRIEGYRKASISPHHFNTTVSDAFKTFSINSKDPRVLRYTLKSRG